MKRLGCLGPEGTFSEEAAQKYRGEREVELVYYSSLEDIFTNIILDRIDEGIVPVENSIEGGVNSVSDILARIDGLEIISELVLPVKHCLISKDNWDLSEIKEILSHPQALAQCYNFLHANLKRASISECNSTAEAAVKLQKSDAPLAAIGSKSAAERYGLKILAEGINDYVENYTRFWVMRKKSSQNCSPKGQKTSLIINIQDEPGALYKILYDFAENKINLTRIESRPSKKNLGQYIFFIDFLGSFQEENVQKALAQILPKVVWIKNLGSYEILT